MVTDKQREEAACVTKEELVALGQRRGYENPEGWAHYKLQGRMNRKPRVRKVEKPIHHIYTD